MEKKVMGVVVRLDQLGVVDFLAQVTTSHLQRWRRVVQLCYAKRSNRERRRRGDATANVDLQLSECVSFLFALRSLSCSYGSHVGLNCARYERAPLLVSNENALCTFP